MQVGLASMRKGGNLVRLAAGSGFYVAFLTEQADNGESLMWPHDMLI